MAGKNFAKKNTKQGNKAAKEEVKKVSEAIKESPKTTVSAEEIAKNLDTNAVADALGAVDTTIVVPEEKAELDIVPKDVEIPNVAEEIAKSEKELGKKMQGKPEEALEFVKEEIKKAEVLEKKLEEKQKEIQVKPKKTTSFTTVWNGVNFGY